jgi:hypothetical protein
LHLQQKIKCVILEEGMHHLVVQVAEDRFNYSSYHTHTHLVRTTLKLSIHLGQCIGKGWRVEQVVLY